MNPMSVNQVSFLLGVLFLTCKGSGADTGAPASSGAAMSRTNRIQSTSVPAGPRPPMKMEYSDTNAWDLARTTLEGRWREALGHWPAQRTALQPRKLGTETLNQFVREHWEYEVAPGEKVDGYLLKPDGSGSFPAVVIFHPTTPFGPRAVAGLEPTYPEDKRQALHLVRHGYVVWCPRNYINTEGADWSGNAAQVLRAHPQWTGMTRMTWDAIRAADFLETLDCVDRQRLGCLGHSLGGKVVLYAMAFDARYKAGVSSEGGVGMDFSNWEALWYLGPKFRAAAPDLEHHQLLALAAPRAFLLIGGESADGECSRSFIDAAAPVYRLYGAEGRLAFRNHHQGHAYPPEAKVAAQDFFARWLE